MSFNPQSCEGSIHRTRAQRGSRDFVIDTALLARGAERLGNSQYPGCKKTNKQKKKHHRTLEPEKSPPPSTNGETGLEQRNALPRPHRKEQNRAKTWAQLLALGFGKPCRCPKLPRPLGPDLIKSLPQTSIKTALYRK